MSNQVDGLCAAKVHGKWMGEESHPHDRSPVAAWGLSCQDRTQVRVITSGGHEDSGWGTKREKGPVHLHQLPTAPFAEMINEIFQVFNIFPEKHSVRQREVFVNSRWIQGEISAPHTAIMQGGNNSEKPNLTGLSLQRILWLSEIKCNFKCLINVAHYFFSYG